MPQEPSGMAPDWDSASSSEPTSSTPAMHPPTTPPPSTSHHQTSDVLPSSHSSTLGLENSASDLPPPAALSITKPTSSGQTSQHNRKTHPKILGPLDLQSQPQTARLLRLPSEIRHKILSYALTASDQKLHYIATSRCFARADIAVGLFTTCHQLALETKHLHLKVNTLCFDNTVSFMMWQRRQSRVEGAQGWRVQVKGVQLVHKDIRVRNRPGAAA